MDCAAQLIARETLSTRLLASICLHYFHPFCHALSRCGWCCHVADSILAGAPARCQRDSWCSHIFGDFDQSSSHLRTSGNHLGSKPLNNDCFLIVLKIDIWGHFTFRCRQSSNWWILQLISQKKALLAHLASKHQRRVPNLNVDYYKMRAWHCPSNALRFLGHQLLGHPVFALLKTSWHW